MTPRRAPLRLARTGVELAVRALPDWHDRLRYRAEFLADLHELGTSGQLRYTVGVLSQTLALRAALGSSPSRVEEDAMTIARKRPFYWRCRVFRLHHWIVRSTEDGGRYNTCSRCGHDRGDASGGGPNVGFMAGV